MLLPSPGTAMMDYLPGNFLAYFFFFFFTRCPYDFPNPLEAGNDGFLGLSVSRILLVLKVSFLEDGTNLPLSLQ